MVKNNHSLSQFAFMFNGLLLIALALIVISTLTGCTTISPTSTESSQPKTVVNVNTDAYMGTWYEVARLPQFFQRNCASDVTANYAKRADGSISVTNRCLRKDSTEMIANGVAEVDTNYPQANNSKLLVNFMPSWLQWVSLGKGGYWILALDSDKQGNYTHSLVGSPNKKYLWVLSRKPNVAQADLERLISTAKNQGFDVSDLIFTKHTLAQTPQNIKTKTTLQPHAGTNK